MPTEDIRFDSAGCTLAGTHIRPAAPVAAALLITGAADLQVPPEDVESIGQLVRGPFEGHVPDDLSHLLRAGPVRAGPRGYRRAVRQPVSPAVLGLITEWSTRQWARGNDRAAEPG
jgi:hypothetical protein